MDLASVEDEEYDVRNYLSADLRDNPPEGPLIRAHFPMVSLIVSG
jgi:hypothetical protein